MSTTHSRTAGVSLVLAALLTLPSCLAIGILDDEGDNVRNTRHEAHETFSISVPVLDRTRLRLEAVSGSIEVTAVPGIDEVTISGTRTVRSDSRADAERHLGDLVVSVRQLSAEVHVQTEQPSQTRGRGYEVEYRITVPASFILIADQVNGHVDVVGSRARIDVGNVNGNIRLHDLAGDVDVDLVNGNIDADVDLPIQGDIDLDSTNGNITLRVPGSVSAALAAQVTNGSISISGLTLTNQTATSRSIRGTLGSGQGSIDVATVNGVILISGTL